MQLFRSGARADAAYKRHTESLFEFIDRSSRADCGLVRTQLSGWFDKYPGEAAYSLARRFGTDFHSCCFELLLHEVLICAQYEVSAEPSLPSVKTRPDFFARNELAELYLEAVVATDESDDDRARKARENQVYDAINSLTVDDYFLSIGKLDIPSNARVVPKKVKAFIRRMVASADWFALTDAARTNDLRQLPCFEFVDERLRLKFQLIPKAEDARGTPSRPIGMYPFRFRWGDAIESIKRAIGGKVAKYGTLDRPFVIAVNSTSEWGANRGALLDALYGTLVAGDPQDIASTRARNGLFAEKRNSLSERVSAVVIGTVWPWALGQSRLELYHNPAARIPLPTDALPFPQTVSIDGLLKHIEGPALRTALHIADDLQTADLAS